MTYSSLYHEIHIFLNDTHKVNDIYYKSVFKGFLLNYVDLVRFPQLIYTRVSML